MISRPADSERVAQVVSTRRRHGRPEEGYPASRSVRYRDSNVHRDEEQQEVEGEAASTIKQSQTIVV